MAYDVEICTARAIASEATVTARARGVPLPEGFCFLVSRYDGTIVQPAFEFFADSHLTIGPKPKLTCSKNTTAAIAADLTDFHHFLDARKKRVSDVDEDLLKSYADTLTELDSVVTLDKLAAATIHRRWSTVTKLVAFCVKRGYLKKPPALLSKQTRRGTIQVLDVDVDLPGLKDVDELITALHPETVVGILDELGPNPLLERSGLVELAPATTAQRLMAELCYHAGLRRTEVCDLQVHTILATLTEGRDPLTAVAIPVIGKGNKKRHVPVPVWLLEALKRYAKSVRQRLVDLRQAYYKQKDHGGLFVLDANNRKHVGNPITPQIFDRHFALARDRLLKRLSNQPDLARYESAQRERITIHALRHTFALYTYMEKRANGDMDAIKYVQSVLGHSLRDTTESIYLRSANAFESETRESIRLHLEGLPFMRIGVGA
ncbi:tyrosine-type recombinase/integrase [Stenotrophomonas maltophilia]|uniref:tyrosine-type recombinase/integrase n=1 Tax=Stenotrophomonas maltophilia TaxID=40324 RepID=UPI0016557C03|nr:tyrosine-type recombinase/integrase [Stenotrophomonas maltophilia]MBC8774886.1 tyrosine-type recombinase/integrase [Stenotrophomonas maltophilia]